MSIRRLLAFGVLSVMLLTPLSAPAQCNHGGGKGGGGGRGGPGGGFGRGPMGSSVMQQMRLPFATSTAMQNQMRNPLLLQQGIAQRMQMQLLIARQQQLGMQNLLELAKQQPERNLKTSLRSANSAVRWAAKQELQRRALAAKNTPTASVN